MGRRKRRGLVGRWRRERRRSAASASAVFRYVNRFHYGEEESRRQAHTASMPKPTGGLLSLRRVDAGLVGFVR